MRAPSSSAVLPYVPLFALTPRPADDAEEEEEEWVVEEFEILAE